MTNEIAKYEPKNLANLDANIGSDIDGEPLRFKDGRFLQGFDKALVEQGTVMRFAPLSIQDGFVKWVDGKPTDWRMREWISSENAILREHLGDEESQWEKGKDPWSFTLIAALKDATGTVFQFSTGTTGGVKAIRRLMQEWRRQRDRHPGLVPVVALNSASYVHKVHKSTVHVPVFEIVSWEPWDENAPPQAAPAEVSTKDELNDEIPF